jgi:modulator of FtsH protease
MNNQIRTDVGTRASGESLLATHTVLRNTYMLLSLTLLFSGLTSWFALSTGAAPLGFVATLVGMFGLLFVTMALRNSAWGILSVFAFTGFMGYTLGPILGMYMTAYSNGASLVTTAALSTAAVFFTLSAYVLVTRKDCSSWGQFLFVGLIVVIVASLINYFLKSSVVYMAVSAGTVFIASLLIMFDTSRIINNGERNYIMATIALYLDIYMLFTYLLQLLSMFSGRE